jgi:hypothetical protein
MKVLPDILCSLRDSLGRGEKPAREKRFHCYLVLEISISESRRVNYFWT